MDYLSLVLQILTVLLLALYAFILFKSGINAKVVKRAAMIITLAGTCIFMYGYKMEGYLGGWVTLFLRGLIASIKMFIYDNSIFESLVAQKSSPYFVEAFVLVYYAAVLTSLSAIILLFGKRLMTNLSLTFSRKKFRHVFIGVNNNSEMIARGIKSEKIAFIEFPKDNRDEDTSISGILKNISGNNKNEGILSSRRVTLLSAKRDLSQKDTEEGVLEGIGLGRLQKRIDKDTCFYILSDDGKKNLTDLLVLVSDDRLRQNITHACVKREGLAQTFNGVLGKSGAHFIYPSSLSVVELMKSPDCHPVNQMSLNGNGTVSGEFYSLILGFGETGRAAAKFLYEFSSAIREDGSPLPIHIHAIDNNMDGIKERFQFSCPALEHDDLITYSNRGPESGDFWNTLLQWIDVLNLVEISLGDDTANLDLACTIYSYVEKKRKGGFNNFRIYVRKKHAPTYETSLVKRLNEKAGQEVIHCFGENSKIFTPEMIVSKDVTGINHSATSLADKLKARFLDVSGAKDDAGTEALTYHEKQRRRRQTHQFISCANHISTKLNLAGWSTEVDPETMENLSRTEHLRYSRYLKAHGYTFDAEDDDVLKTNHQICSWEELPEEDRQRHRDMVKASLSI